MISFKNYAGKEFPLVLEPKYKCPPCFDKGLMHAWCKDTFAHYIFVCQWCQIAKQRGITKIPLWVETVHAKLFLKKEPTLEVIRKHYFEKDQKNV